MHRLLYDWNAPLARAALAASLALAGPWAAAGHAKDFGPFPSEDGAWRATLATTPEAGGPDGGIPRNRLTSLTLRITAKDAPSLPAAVGVATAPGARPAASADGAPSGAPAASRPTPAASRPTPAASRPTPAEASGASAPPPGARPPPPGVDAATAVPAGPKLTAATFDARMPAHNHGMVVKPVLTELAPGLWRIDGVKLHMAGAWELTVTVSAAGQPVRFVIPYQL